MGSERQASRDGVLADEAPALKRWSIGNPMIRLFHLYVPSSLMVLFLVDVALLYSSISLGFIYSYASVSDLLSENTNPSLVVQRVLFVVVVMLSLFTMGAEEPERFARALEALEGAWEIGDEGSEVHDGGPLIAGRIG